jgi:mannitol operon repressor
VPRTISNHQRINVTKLSEPYQRGDLSAADLVDEYPGAMSSFSSRIMACHAMGLISDDERTECNTIRKVRNEFAHLARKSLADKDIESLCSS